MMKKTFSIFLISTVFWLNFASQIFTCALAKEKVLPPSQLNVRQMQTRYYGTKDAKKVYAALVSALQDGGFVISAYESDLGLITARNEYMDKRTRKGLVAAYSVMLAYYGVLAGFTFGIGAVYMIDPMIRMKNEIRPKNIVIDSNVIVTNEKNRIRVRVNFIEKVYNYADGLSYMRPNIRKVIPVNDPKIYQEFFSEVDKSLFLENNGL